MPSGCPDSIRVISGSGPFSPIFQGVWQSLQPEVVTRYLPRASLSAVGSFVPWARAGNAMATVAAIATASTAYSNGMRFIEVS